MKKIKYYHLYVNFIFILISPYTTHAASIEATATGTYQFTFNGSSGFAVPAYEGDVVTLAPYPMMDGVEFTDYDLNFSISSGSLTPINNGTGYLVSCPSSSCMVQYGKAKLTIKNSSGSTWNGRVAILVNGSLAGTYLMDIAVDSSVCSIEYQPSINLGTLFPGQASVEHVLTYKGTLGTISFLPNIIDSGSPALVGVNSKDTLKYSITGTEFVGSTSVLEGAATEEHLFRISKVPLSTVVGNYSGTIITTIACD